MKEPIEELKYLNIDYTQGRRSNLLVVVVSVVFVVAVVVVVVAVVVVVVVIVVVFVVSVATAVFFDRFSILMTLITCS